MVDQLSSGTIGGDFHLFSTRRQRGYLQRYSARLGAAATLRGRGEEYGEKEQMIMRDGNFATMTQKQEED